MFSLFLYTHLCLSLSPSAAFRLICAQYRQQRTHTKRPVDPREPAEFCKTSRQKSEWKEQTGCMMDSADAWFCSRRLSCTPMSDGWAVIVELFHVHLRWMDKQQCPFHCRSIIDKFCCPLHSPTQTHTLVIRHSLLYTISRPIPYMVYTVTSIVGFSYFLTI